MNRIIFILVCVTLLFSLAHLKFVDDDAENLSQDEAKQFLEKRIFGIPFPREQRREAKEKYEERCERTLGKVTSLQRWCPKLEEWDQWQAVITTDKKKG